MYLKKLDSWSYPEYSCPYTQKRYKPPELDIHRPWHSTGSAAASIGRIASQLIASRTHSTACGVVVVDALTCTIMGVVVISIVRNRVGRVAVHTANGRVPSRTKRLDRVHEHVRVRRRLLVHTVGLE